uniref:G-protein coupled receptors family 1 profile domain-containing protein n=1 Tax=Acrobeloides nanus TaxID=290746 RepID=A0A914DNW2_9BILA
MSTSYLNSNLKASTISSQLDYIDESYIDESSVIMTSMLVAVFMGLGYVLYGVAIIFGIPCNIFVLFRMHRLAKRYSEVFSNGIGVCLFTMAVADLISLLSICVHYVLSFNTFNFTSAMHTAICKTIIFSTHVSTSVSIWSWLLMSTLRYLSVYHPLMYVQLWKLPLRMLLLILGGASITNIWLLIAVVHIPGEGCSQVNFLPFWPNSNRVFLFIEIFWSFVIPTATIIFVDSSVFCRYAMLRDSDSKWTSGMRKSYCPQLHKKRRALWRWLIIALVDVVLNAPENINRLAVILGFVQSDNFNDHYLLVRIFSQVLYYFQFGFNGVYLALFIYDKSTKPTKNGRCGSKSLDKKPFLEPDHPTGRDSIVRYSVSELKSCDAAHSGDTTPKRLSKHLLPIDSEHYSHP